MTIYSILKPKIQEYLLSLYGKPLEKVSLQLTPKGFEGDVTVLIFPMLKLTGKNTEEVGHALGQFLVDEVSQVVGFNVVKGYLNLAISNDFYNSYIKTLYAGTKIPVTEANPKGGHILLEYSSPNTNKPLHLGHIRNNLLGSAVAKILEATGSTVVKTQIVNDRGIHICKSMVAWKLYGNGETPETSQTKGDKLVGKYYVLFDKQYKDQVKSLIDKGLEKAVAEKQAPIMLEAQEILKKWEAGDPETRTLWERMNAWVYKGFDETYTKLGVSFDKLYYESSTYLLGKDFIDEGLQKSIFYKKADGSIWIDLTDEGLDEKLVLRSDGTSVYITQDIGTAIQRVKDYPQISGMVYTVGNEQDYHFKVLFGILKRLGFDWADNLYHLSYGMVDLPEGKMKSREGTVVDADELIDQMIFTAKEISEELGKLDDLSENEKENLYKVLAMGALKYYILKVDPKKRILFNPKESIDFAGNTGPFIQYAYARIQSILKKSTQKDDDFNAVVLNEKERELLNRLQELPAVLSAAAKAYSPALIANYTYELVKAFNSFYQNVSILGASDNDTKIFRIKLCDVVGTTIKYNLGLLGIAVPDKM